MRVVKPNQIGLLSRPFDYHNKFGLCVTGLILFPFADPRYPMTESALWMLVGKELGESALDESMPKHRGELLLRANAYAPGGQPSPLVRVAVEIDGKPLKELAAVGDRVWKDGEPTEPEPFLVMPITWANAFGGPEFKRNPLGKGHHGKDGSPLPNIEDRTRLVTSPRQSPEPAGFMPHDLASPQRQEKAGTYDGEWLDKLYPGLAKDIDWDFFQLAPADQQVPGFFRGDEEILLRNMHPEHPELRCKLPEVQLRCFLRRKTRSGPEVQSEVEMKLDTIWLFPHASHGVLVFHGTAPIREDDASDVTVLCLACEDLGQPRPLEHYEKEIERRLKKETGAIAALDDRPLMPPLRGGMKRPPSPADELTEQSKIENLTHKNLVARANREIAAVRDLIAAQGLDPDAHGPSPLPPMDEPQSIEEMLVMAEELQKTLAEHESRAKERVARTEAEVRKTCEEVGLDFDEWQKEWKGPFAGGPPHKEAPEEIATLWALAEEGRAAGVDVSEIEKYLGDPQFVERLRQQDEMELEAYRLGAQDRSPPPARTDEESARLRAELLEAYTSGESLAGRDLTGANLAGIELPGANLDGALMEACDLSRANLSGAKLGRAVLVRASLVDARLDGAHLERANLSKADCTRTRLVDCVLKEALFIKSVLQSTVFDGAGLEQTTFAEVKFSRCSFARVRAVGATFDQLDFAGLSFAHAVLDDAVFMKCVLERADFTGAQMRATTMYGCRADGAILAGITAPTFRIVEGTSLAGCDLRGAHIEGASLRGADLSRSDLSEANAVLADFSECNMQEARLHRVRAKQARFIRTDLTRADLAGADLFEASLAKATLHDADLTGVNLYQADVSMIRGNTGTRLVGAMTLRARVKPFYSDKVQDLD